jgi:hypothetical protein
VNFGLFAHSTSRACVCAKHAFNEMLASANVEHEYSTMRPTHVGIAFWEKLRVVEGCSKNLFNFAPEFLLYSSSNGLNLRSRFGGYILCSQNLCFTQKIAYYESRHLYLTFKLGLQEKKTPCSFWYDVSEIFVQLLLILDVYYVFKIFVKNFEYNCKILKIDLDHTWKKRA